MRDDIGLPRADGGCEMEFMYGLEGEPPGPKVGTSLLLIGRDERDIWPISGPTLGLGPPYIGSLDIVLCSAIRFDQID